MFKVKVKHKNYDENQKNMLSATTSEICSSQQINFILAHSNFASGLVSAFLYVQAAEKRPIDVYELSTFDIVVSIVLSL